MGLKVTPRIPAGNACAVEVRENGEEPEIRFAPSPHRGNESLWFHFRISADQPVEGSRVKLVLKHFDMLRGAGEPDAIVPVYHREGQGWLRMKHGREEKSADGQRQATWYIRYPEPSVDVALCFPYGSGEVRSLVAKSKGYWAQDDIGVSSDGQGITRLSNMYQPPNDGQRGLYLIARHHAGETPGSWVLDGFLRHFSMQGKKPFMIWAAPLCDVDGIMRGCYRADRSHASSPERHVLRADIARWRARCRPLLAIDFAAGTAGDKEGLYCSVVSDADAKLCEAAGKWANIFKNAMTPGFAAPDFRRNSPGGTEDGTSVFLEQGVCALAVHAPYAVIGTDELAQKDYRQIGKRLAEAILRRQGR